MSRFRPQIFVASFTVLGGLILAAFSAVWPEQSTYIVLLDMQVQQNGLSQVFWNEFDDDAPPMAAVIGGSRSLTEFRLPFVRLHRLRIDPTDRSSVDVILYDIRIRAGNKVEVNIPLETIAKWAFINTTKPILANGTLAFRSTNGDPYFWGPVEMPAVGELESLAAFISQTAQSPAIILQLILIGGTIAFLFSVPALRAVALATAMLTLFAVLYYGTPLIGKIIGPDLHDVSNSVILAALVGASILPARWTTILVAVLAIALGLACGTRPSGNAAPASGYWRS